MSNCIYVGDVGTLFKVRIINCDTGSPVDISAATTKEIVFEDPLGAVARKTATFTTNGEDGWIEYVIMADDLDMSGTWKIQGYIEGIGFKNSSNTSTFTVTDILA